MNDTDVKAFIQKLAEQIDTIQDNTVCLLAGDIGNPHEPHYDLFMQFVHRFFPKTFVIPGNHEYYHKTKTIEQTNTFLNEYFTTFDNITLLNNTWEIYQDHCFIGSVLWSHISNPAFTINDINYIPDLNVEKYNTLNQTCVAFLQQAIHQNKQCIVMTHHMPSDQLIDTKYKTAALMPYNQWFYCNVEHLFDNKKVKAWIYGHTHTQNQTIFRELPFLCNPKGYPREKTGFQLNARFSI